MINYSELVIGTRRSAAWCIVEFSNLIEVENAMNVGRFLGGILNTSVLSVNHTWKNIQRTILEICSGEGNMQGSPSSSTLKVLFNVF